MKLILLEVESHEKCPLRMIVGGYVNTQTTKTCYVQFLVFS